MHQVLQPHFQTSRHNVFTISCFHKNPPCLPGLNCTSNPTWQAKVVPSHKSPPFRYYYIPQNSRFQHTFSIFNLSKQDGAFIKLVKQ